MKTKLLLVVLLFTSLSCFSQTKVFPDSVAYWREVSWGGDIMGGRIDVNDYLMLGDTSINGKAYKNLYHHKRAIKTYTGLMPVGNHYQYNDRFGLTNKIGAIRKDSLKVHVIFEEGASQLSYPLMKPHEEYLLMDFSWGKGDTVFSEFYTKSNSSFLVVKDKFKTTAYIGSSDSLEVLTFLGHEPSSSAQRLLDSNLFIYGMGFNSSIFFRFFQFDSRYVVNQTFFGGQRFVASFCSDGELIYGGNNADAILYFNCDTIDINTISVGLGEITKNTLKAYPNPAKEDVILYGDFYGRVSSVTASSVLGEEFPLTYAIGTNTIEANLSNLSNGIYFIKVETSKTSYICKIIKE